MKTRKKAGKKLNPGCSLVRVIFTQYNQEHILNSNWENHVSLKWMTDDQTDKLNSRVARHIKKNIVKRWI